MRAAAPPLREVATARRPGAPMVRSPGGGLFENESSGESAHAARVSAVEPGARLANRCVRARLGAGGMGVVLLAFDERLGREVALKVLAPQAVGDAVARERLLREARSAAALEHPSIVRVYDVGATDDGGVFVVIERVLGHTFHHLLERRLLPLGAALDVLAQVARGSRTRAIASARASGREARERDGARRRSVIKVLDFGLAKPVAGHGPAASLTAAGGFIGTPSYVAPEQAVGGETDGRADVFSLAVMAYEVLAGTLPWPEGNPITTIVERPHLHPARGVVRRAGAFHRGGPGPRARDGEATAGSLRDTAEAFVDAILAVPGLAEAGLAGRHAAVARKSAGPAGASPASRSAPPCRAAISRTTSAESCARAPGRPPCCVRRLSG